jgi:hypothetical protein
MIKSLIVTAVYRWQRQNRVLPFWKGRIESAGQIYKPISPDKLLDASWRLTRSPL